SAAEPPDYRARLPPRCHSAMARSTRTATIPTPTAALIAPTASPAMTARPQSPEQPTPTRPYPMIPPNPPASTTPRNARTYAPRDGSPAGTSESPGSSERFAPFAPSLAGPSLTELLVAVAGDRMAVDGRATMRVQH